MLRTSRHKRPQHHFVTEVAATEMAEYKPTPVQIKHYGLLMSAPVGKGSILTAIHAPEWGGLHGFISQVAPKLQAVGWPLVVVTPDSKDADQSFERLRDEGVDAVRLPLSRLRKTMNPVVHLDYVRTYREEVARIAELGRVRQVVACQAIGLHHFHMISAASALRSPLILQLHGLAVPAVPRTLLSYALARRPDCIMVNGANWHDRFPGLRIAKVPVIPFYAPVDAEAFKGDPEKRARARQLMGVTDRELLVGTVGNFGQRKRHDLFVDVAERVAKMVPDARFRAFGTPIASNKDWYRENVLESPKTKGLIEAGLLTIGSSPAPIRDLLCGFDIFVLTSDNEGIPLVIAEAMSAGVPIVSTDVGAIRDMATPDRVALFAPRDGAIVLADHIVQLARDADRRSEMGSTAQAAIELNFSAQAVVKAHIEAYGFALDHFAGR